MARKKESARLAKLRAQVDSLGGLDRTLIDDLLVEYDALADMTMELRRQVDNTGGVMITKEVGTVNNRHLDTVENPVFTTYSKTVNTLGTLAKKVSDFAGKSEGEDDKGDAFSDFIKGGRR